MQSARSGLRGRSMYAHGKGQRGQTLIEILIAFTAFLIAFLAFSKVIVASAVANTTNHETSVAREAARRMMETLQTIPFDEVFATFNTSGIDDPDGIGTAPGSDFDVPELQVLDDDGDGLAGEILFPSTNGLVLNESLQDPRYGCPRDLNGDGDTVDLLASEQYDLLPIVVRVEWMGSAGPARIELRTQLADY